MAQPVDQRNDEDPLSGFDDFYRTKYRSLVSVVMMMGGTLDEAHDIVGQTMEQMMSRWAEISHPSTYGHKAAVTNFVKYKKRERQWPTKAIEGGHLFDTYDDLNLVVWEDKEWIDQLICALPPRQRQVVEAILDGLTVDEISALFGRTPTAIRQRITRATRKLAQLREHRAHGYGGDVQ